MKHKKRIFYKRKKITKRKRKKNKSHLCRFIIKLLIFIIPLFIYFSNIENNTISIIIPTYNRANIITNSINSILNQTYNDIEILVIDDNSTDNTKQEIDKINDKRIKYIKLEKKSDSNVARNIGIQNAKGKYIAFQDSDDIYHSDKLEKQLKHLIDNKSDLDFCKVCIHIKGYSYPIPDSKREEKFLKNGFFNELCYGNFISTQSILVKKILFDNICSILHYLDYKIMI